METRRTKRAITAGGRARVMTSELTQWRRRTTGISSPGCLDSSRSFAAQKKQRQPTHRHVDSSNVTACRHQHADDQQHRSIPAAAAAAAAQQQQPTSSSNMPTPALKSQSSRDELDSQRELTKTSDRWCWTLIGRRDPCCGFAGSLPPVRSECVGPTKLWTASHGIAGPMVGEPVDGGGSGGFVRRRAQRARHERAQSRRRSCDRYRSPYGPVYIMHGTTKIKRRGELADARMTVPTDSARRSSQRRCDGSRGAVQCRSRSGRRRRSRSRGRRRQAASKQEAQKQSAQ